jgi:hypothetical protein
LSSIGEAWSAILRERRTEPGWHARRVHQGSPCDIHAAVKQPEAIPALLIEVNSRSISSGADLPDCVGFKLALEVTQPGPHGRLRLCLLLKDNAYRDVFEILSEDVAAVVAGAVSEVLGVRLLLGRLHTWERFVSRFGTGLLSDEQQLSLFSELAFLETDVIPIMDAAGAITTWRGPLRERHDFRFRSAAVEIKATLSRNATTVAISNLEQLDPAGAGTLLLLHDSVNLDEANGINLPDLADRIRSALLLSDAAAASDFDLKLLEAGYLPAHAYYYRARKYHLVQQLWYRVAAGFPCLTRQGIPPGVTAAQYSVALVACASFAIDADVARAELRAGI